MKADFCIKHLKSRTIKKATYKTDKIDLSDLKAERRRILPSKVKLAILFSNKLQLFGAGIVLFFGLMFTYSFGLYANLLIVPVISTIASFAVLCIPAIFHVKYLRIIESGEFKYAKFIRSEKLENEEGKSVEYTHYYSFTPFGSDKSFTVKAKTFSMDFADEAEELIAYNPNNPEIAVLIDVFPKNVKREIEKIIEVEKWVDGLMVDGR